MPPKNQPTGTRAPNGASSIYQDKNGKWHGRVTVGVNDDGTTDRRHTESWDRKVVTEKVRQLERERDSGAVRKPGKPWTVAQWLTHWIEAIAAPTVRQTTMVGYRSSVYNHLVPGIGAHRIDKLRPEHLEHLYKRMTDSGLKPATAHLVHRTARVAFNEAARRKYIVNNPVKVALPPRVEEEEIVPLSVEEARKVLNAAKHVRNGTRFALALALGLRQSEALGLQWRDIDLEQGTLAIRRAIQTRKWQHGCTPSSPCGRRYGGHCPSRHSGGIVVTDTKSRSGRRTVGIPKELASMLREHRRQQGEEAIHAGSMWDDGDWVFTNHIGKPVHPGIDHDMWKRLLKLAEVRPARLHDARHTAATMLLVLGVPGRAVMDIMGWSNIAMATRYQHMSSELAGMIADQMSELLWPSTKEPTTDEHDELPEPE